MKYFFILLMGVLSSCIHRAPEVEDSNETIKVDITVLESVSKILLENCKISVRKNNKPHTTLETNEIGQAEIDLPLNHKYLIEFSQKKYVSKTILIDTRNIPVVDQEGGFLLNLEMSLFHHKEGLDSRILSEPIGIAKYDSMRNSIEFDFDYTREILKKVDASLEQAELALLDEFNALMAKAEKLESEGKPNRAKHEYRKAFKLIPSDEKVQLKLGYFQEEETTPNP